MSTSNASHPAASPAARVLSTLFAVATIVFVLLGAVIVVGQILTLAFGQGMAAFDLAETLGPYAFGASSVAGLLAFALMYTRSGAKAEAQHE